MLHLGDITQINGAEVPVVDVVVGGSPCQDLSTAGKRQGLSGARSGLFMEQIRIIKEMRQADAERGNTDVDIRPRYGVWENVTGALSSPGKGHTGEDFAAVLEEFVRIAEPEAPSIPVPEKGWSTSGCLLGDKWSIAWRVLDAQFWGTSDKPLPQRRRRLSLIADFGGHSAPEILFVRKSVSGNIESFRPKGKETSRNAATSTRTDDRIPYTLKIRSGVEKDSSGKQAGKGALIQENKSATLGTTQDQYLFQPITYGISPYHSNAMKSSNPNSGIYEAETARTLDALNCGHPGCNQGGMAVVQPVTYQTVTDPLMANSHPGSYSGQDAYNDMLIASPSGCENHVRYIARRLTPLECERLQGFPDNWTNIGDWVDSKGKTRKLSDSNRFKALGNSIAIPPWKWVLKRLCACYERDATLASLFDGIGGFPYIWEQLNGKGSCLWASEIEEFPIAVTKLRFGEGE